MREIEKTVRERLFALQDLEYQAFQSKLIPTAPPETVIGVRTPALRKLAKELSREPATAEFLECLPHKYLEENSLHGFLIETLRDYDKTVRALDAFLPYVDNWATCDLMSPKVFRKHLPELYEQIQLWLRSSHPYTVRFGEEMLMTWFLDDPAFRPEVLELASSVRSEEYYVNMMTAWFFATALAKQYDAALPYIEGRRLDDWTHNKAIQKAAESYRVPPERKAYLKTLKVK